MSARLEQLLANATPGPWLTTEDEFGVYIEQAPGNYDDGYIVKMANIDKDDAALIALAPDMARLLLDMGEALRLQHTQECGTGYCGNDLEHCERARSLLARLDALGKEDS